MAISEGDEVTFTGAKLNSVSGEVEQVAHHAVVTAVVGGNATVTSGGLTLVCLVVDLIAVAEEDKQLPALHAPAPVWVAAVDENYAVPDYAQGMSTEVRQAQVDANVAAKAEVDAANAALA